VTDTDPRPYDHYRAEGASGIPDGVYRVVGVVDDDVTLLAVADAAGRRTHTGRLVRVPAERVAADFAPASNPDAGASVGAILDWLRWAPRALRDRLP